MYRKIKNLRIIQRLKKEDTSFSSLYSFPINSRIDLNNTSRKVTPEFSHLRNEVGECLLKTSSVSAIGSENKGKTISTFVHLHTAISPD